LTYIQLGAGAGEQDPRAGFRDGFSEFVKRTCNAEQAQIVLLEPNPLNLSALWQSWEGYANAQFHNIAVIPNSSNYSGEDHAWFYYAEEDEPHYQVFSADIEHVRKHYPDGTIRKIMVETLNLDKFLCIYQENQIELLSIDVEGLDSTMVLSQDWQGLANIRTISIEYVHMSSRNLMFVVLHFFRAGFWPVGYGVDYQNLDILFARGSSAKSRIKGIWLFTYLLWKKLKKSS